MLRVRENHRILLIRLGGFGDVLFTLPAVHLVRTAFPKARITFLVYKEFASLLQGFPGLDAVLALDRTRYRQRNPVAICAEAFSLLKDLARGRFDLVVDFQGFGETGLLTWLSRASQRWGSVYRPARRWSYTRPVSRNTQLHPIDYHLDLLRQGGGLIPDRIHNEFMPPKGTLEEARRFFCNHNLDPDRPTLFIQPFTSSTHKNWPLENCIATAQHWRQRGLQVLFGGGPGENAALDPVRHAGLAVAAGAPILLSASLVKLSTVVLGGDTGLLHLAVAMDKRVIMIMGSTHPGACFPFGHREWAILSPDGSTVAAVAPSTVNQACAEALSELGL
jgi:ADP-heptose:LPS heptosyltransferase